MNDSLAKQLVDLLCNYFGDRVMLEVFLDRWGIQTLYSILAEIMGGIDEGGTDEAGPGLP